MFDAREAFPAAVALHQAGRLDDAAAIYRRILDAERENPAALNNLGMIVDRDAAIPLFRRALAVNPDYADALANLAAAHEARGEAAEALACYARALPVASRPADVLFRMGVLLEPGAPDEARRCYLRAAALQPGHLGAMCNIAGLLYRGHELEGALAWYERALAVKPDLIEALVNLGTIHARSGRPEQALHAYGSALALDPGLAVANLNSVSILESEGRMAEARTVRARIARPHELVVEAAPEPRRTVLVLSSFGSGNVPIGLILPRRTTTRIIWYVDHATDAQEATLPPYDIAFNAIGNADITAPSLARTREFHARRPVLNAPDAIERTRRDRMPALLAGIPGVEVPPVALLDRAQMTAPDLHATLARHGIACPVLVRPLSTQGGGGVILAERPEQLRDMALGRSDAFYCIGYHDYRSPDGFFRKYRVLYIDRQPYAYHLAMSRKWLVHYFSADMMDGAWKRQEEQRFLDDPAGVLGAAGMAAIAAIGRRLDLDYAGIDFSLLPDGRILVFEANATMSLHLVESADDFPYKHVHVPAIAQAFDDMLTRRMAS